MGGTRRGWDASDALAGSSEACPGAFARALSSSSPPCPPRGSAHCLCSQPPHTEGVQYLLSIWRRVRREPGGSPTLTRGSEAAGGEAGRLQAPAELPADTIHVTAHTPTPSPGAPSRLRTARVQREPGVPRPQHLRAPARTPLLRKAAAQDAGRREAAAPRSRLVPGTFSGLDLVLGGRGSASHGTEHQ